MPGFDEPKKTPDEVREEALRRLTISPDDPDAWSQFYSLYWPRVYSYMYFHLSGHREQAADLSQEVFIKIAQNVDFKRFNNRMKFEPYLQKMCHNIAVDSFRRLKLPTIPIADIGVEHIPEKDVATTDYLARFWDRIAPVHRQLTDEEKILFGLLLNEATPAEIAAELKITMTNVNVRIHRLRSKIVHLSGNL